jgi:hypothetical protein
VASQPDVEDVVVPVVKLAVVPVVVDVNIVVAGVVVAVDIPIVKIEKAIPRASTC